MDSANPAVGDALELHRERIRQFLRERLPEDWRGLGALDGAARDAFVDEWRATLADAGLLAVTWPERFGGAGWTTVQEVVLHEELARAGAPSGGPNDPISIGMLGATLLHAGTDAQCRRFLPRIISGEDVWCQGYSEPGAGSDLAGVSTRATSDADRRWRINGQKTWTSYGHLANWCFVLARTDPEQQRHRGLSLLLVPMDQPGVTVRPIRMLTGETEFNELFFDDAVTEADMVVGGVGGGWQTAMSLLTHERGGQAAVLWIQFQHELDRLVALVRSAGLEHRPDIRDRLARCRIDVEIMRQLGRRTAARLASGEPAAAVSAMSKLQWSEYHQRLTHLALDVLGMSALAPVGRRPATVAQADDPGAPNDSAAWVGTYLGSRAGTIYAGTSEIQRTILAETALGLPR